MAKIIRGCMSATTNEDIDQIFDFLDINENDIFCDLGSAKGKTVFYSSKTIKFSYGIENHTKDFQISQNYKKAHKISNVKFIKGNYENRQILNKVSDSTIVYCINDISLSFLKLFEEIFNSETLFVTIGYPPYPIKPHTFIDGYFYVMKTPFKLAKNPNEWATSVLGKISTMKDVYKQIRKDDKPKYANDLIDELKEQTISTHWLVKKYFK